MSGTDPVVVYPRGRSRESLEALSPLLVPVSWVWQVAASAVGAVRSADAPAPTEGVRVVSVGNLEVGGNGKTPVCIALLNAFPGAAYVSRGYRSRAERFPGVTLVLPEGTRAPLEVRTRTRYLRREARGLAREIGDEGAVVAARAPQACLAFSRHKREALDAARSACGANLAILDDAFQSRGVERSLDIVMLDAGRPFGNDRLLPAGTLREEPAALERANVILFNGIEDAAEIEELAARVKRAAATRAAFGGIRRRVRVAAEPGTPLAAVSSIGRPAGFDGVLARAGLDVRVSIRFPDHHRYARRDMDDVRRIAGEHGVRTVVTTEKDAVKFDLDAFAGLDVVSARLDIDFVGLDPRAYVEGPRD